MDSSKTFVEAQYRSSNLCIFWVNVQRWVVYCKYDCRLLFSLFRLERLEEKKTEFEGNYTSLDTKVLDG